MNSVRLTNVNAASPGGLSGSVLDPASANGMTDAIGAWNFQPTGGLALSGSPSITFRYDDAMANSLSLDQNTLELFYLSGGTWQEVLPITRDPGNHVITATINGSLLDSDAKFAIGIAGGPGGDALSVTPFAGNRGHDDLCRRQCKLDSRRGLDGQ